MACIDCEILRDNIANLELMIATLDQENRQQHARNKRLEDELAHAERIIEDYREADRMPVSYAKIRESFSR